MTLEQFISIESNDHKICDLRNSGWDKDKVTAAINNGMSLAFVPKEVQTLQECISAVLYNWRNMEHVADRFADNVMVIDSALRKSPLAIQFVKEPTRAQIASAISRNGHAINHVKNPDLELWLMAVKSDPFTLQWLDKDCEHYCEVAEAALQKCGYTIQYVPTDRPDYEELALIAVRRTGRAIKHVPEDMRTHEMWKEAVFNDPRLAEELDETVYSSFHDSMYENSSESAEE